MGKFGINYKETYVKYYEISGDDINTAEEAKDRLLEEIGEGKLNGPEECCESSCEITRLDTAILLISAFDGKIHTERYVSIETAAKAMQRAYENAIPEEWEQAYEDLSYVGQRSAVLYANGEDVYTWRIEEVELESPAVTL